MEVTLATRRLTEKESDMLVEEIKKFPNPFTDKKTWLGLEKVCIAYVQENLAGVCGARQLAGWIKLGPFVVFEKYQGKGLGRTIIERVIKNYPHENLFIGSRNKKVMKLAISLGFREEKHIWRLSGSILRYLIENMCVNISPYNFKEFIRKKSIQEGPFRFFVREVSKK